MSDWRQKITDAENSEKSDLKKKEDLIKELDKKRVDNTREENIKRLGQRFQCQILNHGKPSHKPAERGTGSFYERDITGTSGTQKCEVTVEDWSMPGDLRKCKKCQRWACDEHIFKDVCQECAEKL